MRPDQIGICFVMQLGHAATDPLCPRADSDSVSNRIKQNDLIFVFLGPRIRAQ